MKKILAIAASLDVTQANAQTITRRNLPLSCLSEAYQKTESIKASGSGGIKQIKAATVDFGGTDELTASGLVQLCWRCCTNYQRRRC
jgi:hypothetical protein